MRSDTHSSRSTARRAGLLYLAMGIPAAFNLQFRHAFIVGADPAATMRNLVARELLYRWGVLAGLVSGVAFLFLASALYEMFEVVDRRAARVMVLLIILAVAVGTSNLIPQLAPLVLLKSASFTSSFTREQTQSIIASLLQLASAGEHVAMAFWGLWLFPFGLLGVRSGVFPRWLGALLMIGCFAYVTVCISYFVNPTSHRLVNLLALPFYSVGEIAAIAWLLVGMGHVRTTA